MREMLALLVFLAGAAGAVDAQLQAPLSMAAPVEREGFSRLSSYDTLQAFLARVGRDRRVRLETIAVTRQGRMVVACLASTSPRFGLDPRKLRVLLFAQQHGNEPSGKEAMTLLLAKIASGDNDDLLERCDLMIVPQMNPDGSELRQRRTSDSLDLNRTHLLLTSPEPRGLHDLFERWRPEVTLDVHEFNPYGSEWTGAGFVKTVDVQYGVLTNVNSPKAIRDFELAAVCPAIAQAMDRKGYRFHEYLVGDPKDGARFSTTEINDGRQSFGILGTLSFIQEGRGGKTLEDNLERRVKSQLASIEALLSFCREEAGSIKTLITTSRARLSHPVPTDRCVLYMDHYRGSRTVRIPVATVPGGRDSVWTVDPMRDSVGAGLVTTMPAGYIVPRELENVRQLLDRHHVEYTLVAREGKREVMRFELDTLRVETWEEEQHERPALRRFQTAMVTREGDLLVPTAQLRSHFLVTLLEPDSMWGLVKYPQFRFLLNKGLYPIARY
jgi:hypothetical protein